MATNLQRFTLFYCGRRFVAWGCWTHTSWQVMQRDSDHADCGKPRTFILCEKKHELVYSSGSPTVVRVPLVVREGFSGGTRTAFLSYWKALLIRFCVIIRSCLMLVLLIRLFAILILSIFWENYVLLKLGVYTRTLKKYQVVRDLKTFENHWSIAMFPWVWKIHY